MAWPRPSRARPRRRRPRAIPRLRSCTRRLGSWWLSGIFCRKGSRDERPATSEGDRAGARAPVDHGAVPPGVDQSVVVLLCGGAGDGRHAGADGGDRRFITGSPMVRQPPNGATPVPPRPCGRASAGAAADGVEGTCAHLPALTNELSAPRAPDLPVPAVRSGITRPAHVWCADVTYLPMRRASSTSSSLWTGRRARCSLGGGRI